MDDFNTYLLTPISKSAQDVESFQGVVRLARRLQGDGVTIKQDHIEHDSGQDFVDALVIEAM